MRFLWTGSGTPPGEYTILQLCRDVYHCTPSQLMQEDANQIDMHLLLMSIESEVQAFENQGKKPTTGSKKKKTH